MKFYDVGPIFFFMIVTFTALYKEYRTSVELIEAEYALDKCAIVARFGGTEKEVNERCKFSWEKK